MSDKPKTKLHKAYDVFVELTIGVLIGLLIYLAYSEIKNPDVVIYLTNSVDVGNLLECSIE